MHFSKTIRSKLFAGFFIIALTTLCIALLIQYVGGKPPCELCLLGRYPYATVVLLSALGISFHHQKSLETLFMFLIAIIFSAAIGLSFYHVGVEQKWWLYDGQCHFPFKDKNNIHLDQILSAPPPRCDQITFSFLGFSLTAYSVMLSFLLSCVSWYCLIQYFIRDKKS
jgi:disulfide bond formation protein DsbB